MIVPHPEIYALAFVTSIIYLALILNRRNTGNPNPCYILFLIWFIILLYGIFDAISFAYPPRPYDPNLSPTPEIAMLAYVAWVVVPESIVFTLIIIDLAVFHVRTKSSKAIT
jgi:hypothetical protein